MNASADLRLLLTLRNDPATDLGEDGVPSLLRNPQDRDAWTKLQQLLDAPLDPAAPLTVSESLVAAYLEGALSADEAEQVERACWSDSAAMQELASIHRDFNQPVPDVDSDPIDAELQARLLGLNFAATSAFGSPRSETTSAEPTSPEAHRSTDESATSSTAADNRLPVKPSQVNGRAVASTNGSGDGLVPTPPPAPPTPPTPPPTDPSVRSLDESARGEFRPVLDSPSPVERALDRHSTSGGWLAAAMIAGVMLLAAWAVWSQLEPSGNSPDREIAAPPLEEDLEPRDPLNNNRPAPGPDDPLGPDPPTAGGTSKDSTSGANASERPQDNSDSKDEPSSDPGSTPSSETDVDPWDEPPQQRPIRRRPRSYPAIAFDWRKVRGLVIARDDSTTPWRGAESEKLEAQATDFATLPGSWATAATNRFGEVVFDSNTRIEVAANDVGDSPVIDLRHGRLAFRNTPREQKYEFRTGVKHFSVQAPKSSSFAVVYGPGGPQVWVRRGDVQMGAKTIKRNQHVRWSSDGFGDAERIREGTSWFDEPPKNAVRIDDEVQARMLQSDNIFATLAELSQTGAPDVRAAATAWSIVANPNISLHQGLTSPSPLVRNQTLRWFHAQDPQDRRMGLLWRLLGQECGDLAAVRQIHQWAKRTWQQQRPDAPAALQMVQALSHNDQAIRQLAISYLEMHFGHRFAYSPVERPITQRQAITRWTQFIRAFYAAQSRAQSRTSQQANPARP